MLSNNSNLTIFNLIMQHTIATIKLSFFPLPHLTSQLHSIFEVLKCTPISLVQLSILNKMLVKAKIDFHLHNPYQKDLASELSQFIKVLRDSSSAHSSSTCIWPCNQQELRLAFPPCNLLRSGDSLLQCNAVHYMHLISILHRLVIPTGLSDTQRTKALVIVQFVSLVQKQEMPALYLHLILLQCLL